jgi:hypothetical protein
MLIGSSAEDRGRNSASAGMDHPGGARQASAAMERGKSGIRRGRGGDWRNVLLDTREEGVHRRDDEQGQNERKEQAPDDDDTH